MEIGLVILSSLYSFLLYAHSICECHSRGVIRCPVWNTSILLGVWIVRPYVLHVSCCLPQSPSVYPSYPDQWFPLYFVPELLILSLYIYIAYIAFYLVANMCPLLLVVF